MNPSVCHDIQAEDGLNAGEERRDVEGLEEDLRGFIPIPSRVQRCLCQQNRMLVMFSRTPDVQMSLAYLLAQGLEAFRVDPAPYPLHVVPVGDDSMFHRISESEETSQILCSSTYQVVLVDPARHDALIFRSTDAAPVSFRAKGSFLGKDDLP